MDEEFRHPRLAAIYDALAPDRRDLAAYLDVVDELGGRRVLDVGCGTGTLALMLAERGRDVVAVDPASASLAVARAKPGAERVRWIDGAAAAVPQVADRDVAIMTGNAAQAISDPQDWDATLRAVHGALRPGGHLVFETRDPAARAWEAWTRTASHGTTEIAGAGAVTSWVETTTIEWHRVRRGRRPRCARPPRTRVRLPRPSRGPGVAQRPPVSRMSVRTGTPAHPPE